MAGKRPAGRESEAPRVTTLLRAVQRGDYGVLTSLLGSSNGEDHQGNANLGLLAALLVEASGREHLDCIELLLQKMMKPSPKRNLKRRGYFPMHTAAGAGATESIELLLSAGLSPKTRDRSGRTPLHLAAAQGSAECASLLCTVARSTVVSRDRVAGDTPVHFAVRARNGVCIEVLLAFAQGEYDILRETNAKGETPLDVANAIGDASLILRSGHATRGGGRAHPGGGVDIQRIMAVWERFFENAAVACVGGRDTSRNQSQDQRGTSLHQTAKPLGVGDWVELGDQPATIRQSVKKANVATTRGKGAREGAERDTRSGDEETGWGEGEVDIPSLAGSSRDHQQLSRLPGALGVERARICAWEAAPIDPLGDREGESFCCINPQQQLTTELHVQLENEAHVLSPDDVDLHLFQTPRGDSSGAEIVWLSASHQGEIYYASDPPADDQSPRGAALAAGNLLQRQPTWVACWDATSESIYFWDSESGRVSWDAPALSTDGVYEPLSRVWDPQRGAFFTVDKGGTSRWLADSTIEGRATVDDSISLGTTVPSAQGTNHGRADSSPTSSTARSSWRGFESSTAVAESAPSTEAVGRCNKLYATLDGAEGQETAVGGALTQAQTEPTEQIVRLSQYSLAEVGYQRVGLSPDGLYGCNYRGEQSSRSTSKIAPQKGATAAGEERPLSLNAAAASTKESAGEDDNSDGVEFFDSRTCEGHCQLSAWVLWYTAPSRQDGDGPPYFVNEETGTSVWVLPPEAVATSGGWLRAWSEEHQAWFYANQWTGRATWELQDLEAEGVVESSACVER